MASRPDDNLPDTVSENGEGTANPEGRSRRDVLRGLAAAAAGAVAGGVLSAEKAEAGHANNNFISFDEMIPAVHAENPSAYGTAIQVESTGLLGTGVIASSPSGTAVTGESLDNGRGVLGFSARGVGVQAHSSQGTALYVLGKAQFSSVGSGSIPANQASVFVSASLTTALSHVTVTLTGDPGQAGSAPGLKPVVVWVERMPTAMPPGFTVHMSKPVRVDTPFTYLIVEPV